MRQGPGAGVHPLLLARPAVPPRGAPSPRPAPRRARPDHGRQRRRRRYCHVETRNEPPKARHNSPKYSGEGRLPASTTLSPSHPVSLGGDACLVRLPTSTTLSPPGGECLLSRQVVVSLTAHGEDHLGGLFVSTTGGARSGGAFHDTGGRRYLGLGRGDAVVHQSTLLHGVRVIDLPAGRANQTKRWSWILWYKDSATCEDFGHEWFEECALEGNPACMLLHATKLGGHPGVPKRRLAAEVLRMNREAALAGSGLAAVKVAKAHLKQLPSDLPLDPEEGRRFFELAVNASAEPDAHFGLAQLLLADAAALGRPLLGPGEGDSETGSAAKVAAAVGHLEAAARSGSAFSMFNLGIAHMHGYAKGPTPRGGGGDGGGGGGVSAGSLAGEWFEVAGEHGLCEGFAARGLQLRAAGELGRARDFEARAAGLGFGAPWRKHARDMTGTGQSGASGVDLNCVWPPSPLKLTPARW
mmetsp:Transcript_62315/g.140932  ORF Transcript_62315/g.140932 Transcript_62315/m.140932 type:complete len:469 (-) Transcript_62315:84-1490(-)